MQNAYNMKKVIILFSGGYDSTLLFRMAREMEMEPFCLLFDYGQKHIAELERAKALCDSISVPYQVLKIPIGVSSKLTHGDAQYEGVSEWHVPARNLTFLSFAAGIAEEKGIDLIWYGANYQDRINLFPDCYQEWVYRLNQLLEINGSRKITVEAPLIGMTKETIEAFGQAAFGIKREETFSGYGEI